MTNKAKPVSAPTPQVQLAMQDLMQLGLLVNVVCAMFLRLNYSTLL